MRRSPVSSARLLPLLLAAWFAAQPGAAGAAPQADALAEGLEQCDRGQFGLAIETLREAYRANPTGEAHLRAAGALGLAYQQTRQPAAAAPLLREAFDGTTDPRQQARYGLDLANLEAGLRRVAAAERLYDTVLRLAPDDAALRASVALNRIPLAPADRRPALLAAAGPLMPALPTAGERGAFALNLGLQARATGDAAAAGRLAYAAFADALAAGREAADPRLVAAAQNQLAQMYEDAHRPDEALRLTTDAIRSAQAPSARDLLVPLEWRRGRLLAAQGRIADAIGAYQRAVDTIEAVRQDIPVEYENGRSSFRDTLEPVYLGLADLLLRQASQLDAAAERAQLLRVRDTLETIKQTELEDFLGSRCAVEGARRATPVGPRGGAAGGSIGASVAAPPAGTSIPAGTAVLYPVILPDRLELLVETSAGLSRRTVAVSATDLRRDAAAFAAALRARRPATALAERLYRTLLLPAVPIFEHDAIDTVVVVPDGALRLVPFGALQDGARFAIERWAFAVVPAVTLPEPSSEGSAERSSGRAADPTPRRPVRLLLAGVSAPGAAVEKLPPWIAAQLLSEAPPATAPGAAPVEGEARASVARGLTTRNLAATDTSETGDTTDTGARTDTGATSATSATSAGTAAAPPTAASSTLSGSPDKAAARRRTLQDRLALAGVVGEIDAISKLAPSTTLLNDAFSVRSFSEQVATGRFSVVHVASHGVFGPTADATFLMAHDDLITIDQLQAFLRGPALREHPVELLTLSACETAEGDDRAPLGLSGAALKAQAQSALGSLWPVSDDAAQSLMGSFYGNLTRLGLQARAKALQAAQVSLIGDPALRQPYFWAPFILVERRL